jgi:deoxyribodipyrimidine photo-lyase
MIGLGRTMPPRAAAAAGPACRVVVWFRGADLRVDDNPALADAARRVRVGEASEVVPVFCYDPRWFKETRWATGHGKTGNHRSQFLLESVAALKAGLRAVGSDVVVAAGAPEAVLPALAAGGPVLAAAEAAPEERGAEAAVSAALTAGGGAGKLVLFWMSTLYHLDDLPYSTADLSDMPDGFTAFKNKVEAKVEPRAPLPPPAAGALPPPRALAGVDPAWCPTTLAELAAAVTPGGPLARAPPLPRDARAALDFRGGEPAALARLRYYLWDTDLVATYFDTRNEMLGGDGSTKFAPWLSHGCLSPRRIAAEVRRYEAARGGNKSTYWVIFELTWRDFFRFQALKHGGALFAAGGPAGAVKAWAAAPALLARWREGRTGWPLVDANMRELAATVRLFLYILHLHLRI